MAKGVRVTLTNISNGPRGISSIFGKEVFEAGETREVELLQGEADNLEDLSEWFKVSGKAKAAAKADGDKGYDGMKRDELDKLAAERGIDISDASNKAEVIALLEAADQA